jgi:hypothetical protein
MPFSSGVMPTGAAFTEYQAITRRAFLPTVYVQIFQASPTIAALMQHAKTASGGISSVTVPVQGQAMTVPQWTGFDGSFSQPANIQGVQPAEFNLKSLVTPIPFYGFEAAIQADHAIVPRIEVVFNDATNSTVDVISNALYTNVTNTQQLIGFNGAIDDGTNAASYGNINRSASTFWQAKVYNAGAVAPTRALILQYLMGAQKYGAEMPTCAVLGMGTWEKLVANDYAGLESYQILPGTGFDSDADRPRSLFRALDIGGVPVYCDPYCPEGIMYVWNSNYMQLYFHSMANFAFTGFESLLPVYQIGFIGGIVSLFELVCAKPRTTVRVGTVSTVGSTGFTYNVI